MFRLSLAAKHHTPHVMDHLLPLKPLSLGMVPFTSYSNLELVWCTKLNCGKHHNFFILAFFLTSIGAASHLFLKVLCGHSQHLSQNQVHLLPQPVVPRPHHPALSKQMKMASSEPHLDGKSNGKPRPFDVILSIKFIIVKVYILCVCLT